MTDSTAIRRAALEEALKWAQDAVEIYFNNSAEDGDDEIFPDALNEAIAEHFRALADQPLERPHTEPSC